jgi:hypothetical protein
MDMIYLGVLVALYLVTYGLVRALQSVGEQS